MWEEASFSPRRIICSLDRCGAVATLRGKQRKSSEYFLRLLLSEEFLTHIVSDLHRYAAEKGIDY
jgi:hypothetical protein